MAKKKNTTPQKPANKPAKNRAPIHTEILIRPIHRGVNDIGTWRGALRLADLDNRTKLYDLYTDLLIDGYLSDAIDKRLDAVTDAELSFTSAGKQVDAMTDLMDTPEFENFLREIMLSRFWGVSLDECYFADGFNFKSIPRKHIRLKTKEIALREEDLHGIDYSANAQIIQFGTDDDYGILLRVAPYVIYKRGGFGDWAQFVELFGMPQRIGKYSSMDEQSRRALIQAFEEAGSAPYLVIPKETEATQTTLSNSGNGALYNDFRGACNEEILITILGQTMTTQDGSSLAQGQVHLAVQEKKHRADRRFVERMLNKHFVPLLENRGYPVRGGKFKFLDKAQELTVADTIQLSGILPIPQSYLYNKYNIPMPEGDEPVAGREPDPLQIALAAEDATDDPSDPDDREKEIKNEDRSWWQSVKNFFVGAPLAGAINGKTRIRLGDDTRDNRIINRVADSGGNLYFDPELFAFFADAFLQAVGEGCGRTIGLTDFVYAARDDAFITAMEMNVFHFSAAKTLAELQELNRLFRESRSFAEFYKKAQEVTNTFNKRWQKTEYETAVLTAESASNYQQLIGSTKLFPYWMYRTVGDENVRPEHAALDGLILPANDPRWNKIFPPNGWKCRCRVEPLMAHEVKDVDFKKMQKRCDDYFGTTEWQTVEAQHWDSNRGKRSEVFDKNQMYIRKFPDVAAKMMDKVPLATWGITPSLKKRIRESSEDIPFYEGEPERWWNEHKTMRGELEALAIKDYNGREWFMNRADYDIHTTNKNKKREFRTGYLSCLQTILSDPDEVWLGQEYKDRDNQESLLTNYIYIKYYKDKALACSCKLENGKQMKLKTWFEVRDPKIRKGLLLKAKK